MALHRVGRWQRAAEQSDVDGVAPVGLLAVSGAGPDPRVVGFAGTDAGDLAEVEVLAGWRCHGMGARMLYVYGFDRVGVAVGDLFFVDPRPHKGQEGAEHGVRLELRLIERGPLRGTIYSATPIAVERPVWRVDLLESVDGRPGSFDRTHYHPACTGTP